MEDLSDDDLLLLYRQGEMAAFETLFARHHAAVYSFARYMLGNAASADELAQETFLAVARAAPTYQARGQFRTWLMRITRNHCLHRIESEAVRQRAIAESGLHVQAQRLPEPDPADSAQAQESAGRLRRLIAALPARQREAIVLWSVEGMSYLQIAGVLEVPVNTVKTLIHRARAELARGLEGEP